MKKFFSKLIVSSLVLFSLVSFTFVQAANIYPVLGALTGGGTGALDKIDGSGLSAGDAAVVVLSTGSYHYTNIQDSAAENSPYVIRPDTNPGTNSWHLVIPQGPMSHVRVNRNSVQSISDISFTTAIFNSEIVDTLSEYNTSTGEFTATYDGYYIINSQVLSDNVAWTAGKIVICGIIIDSTTQILGQREVIEGNVTRAVSSSISTSIYLTATQTIEVEIYHNRGSNTNFLASNNYNWLTIDRLM